MLLQVIAQTGDVAGIEEFDSATECGVLDPFMVRQTQIIGESWLFDVPFQSRPAGESILAGDGELSIAKTQTRVEDFRVGCA
jgi:hypothetical protein